MKRKKIKIGDIFRIPLSNDNYAFGQYVFWDNEMGPLVQIFDLITNKEIEVDRLKNTQLLFPPVITGLFTAIRSGLWMIIGHLPITEFVYPNFVSAHYNEKTFVAHAWFLWDGEKYIPLGSDLPLEYHDLEYLVVWGADNLIRRIETGENFYDRLKVNKST